MTIHDMMWTDRAQQLHQLSQQLQLYCSNAVFGFRWQPALSGSNRLGDDRLFMIFPDSDADGELHVDAQTCFLRPASAWLVPAASALRFRFGPGLNMFACHLIFPNLPLQSPFPPGLHELSVARSWWQRLSRLLQAADAAAACELNAMLQFMLVPALKPGLSNELNTVHQRFAPLWSLLEHVDASTRISDCARALDMTPNACAQAFRRGCGRSLGRTLQSHLARRACRLLLADPRPIAAIAAELRFSDPFHFSRFINSTLSLAIGHSAA